MALPQTQPEPATKNLILDSLEVQNFRAFRHLQIPKLGRVNLITGKNNVGKSSLLEALWLYSRNGSVSTLRSLLTTRDEFRPNSSLARLAPEETISSESLDEVNEALRVRTLFNGRPRIEEDMSPIAIGAMGLNRSLRISIRWLTQQDSDDSNTTPHIIDVPLDARKNPYLDLYVAVESGNDLLNIYKLDDLVSPRPSSKRDLNEIASQFVRSGGVGDVLIGTLWDRVTLTSAEDDVLTSLRVVTERVNRITLVGDRSSFLGRIPVVKMAGLDEPVPMRSLGEGTNRLFGITLALANTKDGLLLIDEVENGLHYSVLPDVWRLVFQTARRLNVQVFATTHSWDCIEAFQKAAAEDEQDEGVLVRLQNKDGDVTATVFDERRLAVVTREGIEVR